MRACALLPAVTGNLGKAGRRIPLPERPGARGIDDDYLTAAHLRRGRAASSATWTSPSVLEDPRPLAGARLLEHQHRGVEPASSTACGTRSRREDLFTVVVDLFPTDTADFADVVLPAASFLEFDDLVCPYFHLALSAQVKAMEPLGEALPNQEIFRRLAARDGLRRAGAATSPTRASSTSSCARAGLGIEFEELAAAGTVPLSAEPLVQFADLVFPTPSGRDRDRLGRRRGGRPPAGPASARRPAAARTAGCGCCRPPRLAPERQLRQRPRRSRSASAPPRSRCTPTTPPRGASRGGDDASARERDRPAAAARRGSRTTSRPAWRCRTRAAGRGASRTART